MNNKVNKFGSQVKGEEPSPIMNDTTTSSREDELLKQVKKKDKIIKFLEELSEEFYNENNDLKTGNSGLKTKVDGSVNGSLQKDILKLE